MAVAYLLGGYRDLHFEFPKTNRFRFASRLLGSHALDASFARVQAVLTGWGYAAAGRWEVREALCDMALTVGSGQLEEIAARFDAADLERESGPRIARAGRLLVRVLAALGLRESISTEANDVGWVKGRATAADVLPEWTRWSRRWFDTATLSRRTREEYMGALMKAGRWMTVHHPEAASPSAWTRSLAAEYVAAVDRMTLGEWSHMPHTRRYLEGVGRPLDPATKAAHLGAIRAFFRDAQEWGWIHGRFDAGRVFRTPPTMRALIGPEPRVINDDVWAKLLWAGLNLAPADLRRHGWSGRGSWYPFDLVQAIAVTWLFAGLRMNEIVRLRVGCIRWQADIGAMAENGSQPLAGAVCLLDVPVTKTGGAFTKPVDRLVGDAIGRWEEVRPAHLPLIGHKTGERVDLLFAYRGHRLGSGYVNHVLIPLLSAKANVPTADARGRITSHRARSTIATQLYNAKDPMTLFELQAWLGHRSPASTQYYAKITPMTLAKAYTDAGYFARNVRAIEVLVDRDAVQSGAGGLRHAVATLRPRSRVLHLQLL